MNESDLKRGKIYRLGRSNVAVLLIFEWPPNENRRHEFEYVTIDHTGTVASDTTRDFAESLARKLSHEIKPPIGWISVDTDGVEVCSTRGWHDMPSSLPDARCKDCAKSLMEVAREHAAREPEPEPAPEEPEAQPEPEITAEDLLGSYLG